MQVHATTIYFIKRLCFLRLNFFFFLIRSGLAMWLESPFSKEDNLFSLVQYQPQKSAKSVHLQFIKCQWNLTTFFLSSHWPWTEWYMVGRETVMSPIGFWTTLFKPWVWQHGHQIFVFLEVALTICIWYLNRVYVYGAFKGWLCESSAHIQCIVLNSKFHDHLFLF